jgi:glycosyltransferase involved in cell wall biosynthesis
LVGKQKVDLLFGTLIRDSDLVAVMTEYDRDQLVHRAPTMRNKITVVPPPAILPISTDKTARDRERKNLGLLPNDFLLAYFGYVYPGKGIDSLMRALRIVAESKSHVRLIMIGGSQEDSSGTDNERFLEIEQCTRDMKKLAEELGIAKRVIWTGRYASDSDRASTYLRAADACALPFDDGISLIRSTVAAAATHQLPIISTQGKSLESPFIDRENVLLCSPKDSQSLALAINSLIDNKELCQRLQQGAKELACEWFSWNRLDKALKNKIGLFLKS